MHRSHVPRAVALPDGRILSFAVFGDPAGRPVIALHGTEHGHAIWALADAAGRRRQVCLIAPERPDRPADLTVLADAVFVEELRLLTLGGGAEHGLAAAHHLRLRVRRLALVAPGEQLPALVDAPCPVRRWDGAAVALLVALDPVLGWLCRP
jgi:hypothetical protein